MVCKTAASAEQHGISLNSTAEDNTATADGQCQNYDESQIMELAVNEYAFFPFVFGRVAKDDGLFLRARIADMAKWTGDKYAKVEYAIFNGYPNVDGFPAGTY